MRHKRSHIDWPPYSFWRFSILCLARQLKLYSFIQPTAGLVEIEPSMAWNPSVVSGIGVVQDVDELYNDMHSYLASAGYFLPCAALHCMESRTLAAQADVSTQISLCFYVLP